MTLTQETVRELLHYEPETGRFTWLPRNRKWFETDRDWKIWNTRYADKPAGSAYALGYLGVGVLGRHYFVHRLAWLYQTGVWPPADVDHINRERADNRWANLRLATRAENLRNAKVRITNTSGYQGVTRHRKKWRALIRVDGKDIYLGSFVTPEGASLAYRWAAERYHREFANGAG